MARDVDVVIEAVGSNPFRPFSEAEIDKSTYERAKKVRNLTRTLVSIRCGADNDLKANRAELLAEIDKATGGQPGRIGALCLYGNSNGSGLILSLAKAMQDRGTPRATYVGMGDLTMMPFGRNPAVPDIGDLQPLNAPTVALGLRGNRHPVGILGAAMLPPSVSDGPPPHIADPGIVADKLENFFTVQGNRARVFARSPAGAVSWWWTSTQTFGEVHGEVKGWTNLPRTTVSEGTILARGPGSIDEGHHDNLCAMAMLAMRHEAGLALAGFVTTLTP